MDFFNLMQKDMREINAPDIPLGLTWLNSPPLSLKNLKGKVILIDFWTYSCINCQRTLPYIRSLWDKYMDSGLVIIGVHSPEFEFEKDPKNLEEALKMYKVTWPVVMDNNFEIWNEYDNHYWPAKYLVDHNGQIIYTHFGEGNYLETERRIQDALKNVGFKVSKETIQMLITETAKLGQTPEIYLGYLRGDIGNIEGFQKERNFFYDLSFDTLKVKPDTIYINGNWRSMPQFLEHELLNKKLEDYLLLNFRAKKVYLVMESANSKPIKAYISLDEVGLKKEFAGTDIKYDKNGEAYVEVQFSTLYNLINLPNFGDHLLKISTNDSGLRLFAFTFGS